MNLMNSYHKATNKAYREGWDRVFGTSLIEKEPEIIESKSRDIRRIDVVHGAIRGLGNCGICRGAYHADV